MARGVNKVILIGNVGKDPEIRSTKEGTCVANFNLATSSSYLDKKTKEKVETSEWHRISAFGKLAEIIEKYVKKGSKLYICGSLTTQKYLDKNGLEKYTTSIIANELQMLGGTGEYVTPDKQDIEAAGDPPPQNYADDDIPF